MTVIDPSPEDMESALGARAAMEVPEPQRNERSAQVRAEGVVAARYWGEIQYRMIALFVFFSVCWIGVVVAGISGDMPLWVGLMVNSVLATTFYMPMHEATHKNIMGRSTRGRIIEEAIEEHRAFV